MAEDRWTLDELWRQLAVWEEALYAEGYSQSTVWTYIRGAQTFLRWLGGDAGPAGSPETAPR